MREIIGQRILEILGGVFMAVAVLAILAIMFLGGAASVLRSDGYYDAENNQFCVVWANDVWAWDMPD